MTDSYWSTSDMDDGTYPEYSEEPRNPIGIGSKLHGPDRDLFKPVTLMITEPVKIERPGKAQNSQGKDRWDLIPMEIVTQIVKAITHGAKKYDDHEWKEVENGQEVYFAACMRHIAAWRAGEKVDSDSGLHPLAHALASLVFTMWHAIR